jgi:transglutaminase-like putative cysteine protease
MSRIITIDRSNYKINRIIGILWIASFALFKSDISYLFFMLGSLFLIFKTINYSPKQNVNILSLIKLKSINLKESTIGIIIIVLLFIFFPRFHGFLPRANQTHKGKIGYSKTIDNSSITNLLNSSKLAFIAQTGIEIPNERLYWRGRALNFTDGHNWRSVDMKPIKKSFKSKGTIKYQIKYEQDFGGDFILLDTPVKVLESNIGYYLDNSTNTYHTYIKGRKSTVTAMSTVDKRQDERSTRNDKYYLQLPGFLPSDFKQLVVDLKLKNKDIDHIAKMFSVYLNRNEFTYTLNPGDVTTLAKFIKQKRGYCTHFASLFGITLRYLGIPTRLISGFQGGIYNSIGKYYSVSSNDGHAWVEAKINNKWKRLDPTGFIDPSRIKLGGEQYFNNSANKFIQKVKSSDSNFLNYLKQYISVINYKISLFIDNFDISEQRNISKKLKISNKQFFLIGFSIIIIIIIGFYFYLNKTKNKLNPIDKYFLEFVIRCNKNKVIILNTDNLAQMREKLYKYPKAILIVDLYEKVKYQNKKEELLKLKKLIYTNKTFQ